MTESTTAAPTTGWRGFWNRGGWWKAVLVVVVYAVVYQLLPVLFLPLTRGMMQKDTFATAGSVFAAITVPVLIGSIVLLVFSWTLGWVPRPLFTKQPVRGSWWMWIALVLAALPIVLRLFGTDYSQYSLAVIVVTFLTGLLIGFSEELLTRGLVVTLMRKHGYGEWVVAAISALLFGLLHSSNIFTGQSVLAVGGTVVYTVAFGVLMYLVMRVTGNLVWAMVVHGLTDPTTFLATGGVDKAAAASSPLLAFAGLVTTLLIVGGFVLLIFIRGRAEPTSESAVKPTATA
jgi:membrane protease YdiL (CAAX protease family)